MSVGVNKWRNNPTSIEPSKVKWVCSVHAEVDALSRVNDPRGATVYVARVNGRGEMLLSRPCDTCLNVLIQAGVSKVVHC